MYQVFNLLWSVVVEKISLGFQKKNVLNKQRLAAPHESDNSMPSAVSVSELLDWFWNTEIQILHL